MSIYMYIYIYRCVISKLSRGDQLPERSGGVLADGRRHGGWDAFERVRHPVEAGQARQGRLLKAPSEASAASAGRVFESAWH